MGKKMSLHVAEVESKSLDKEMMDQLDNLIDRAKEQNLVLNRMLSTFNFPAIQSNKDNESTENMNLFTASLELTHRITIPGKTRFNRNASRRQQAEVEIQDSDYSTIEELITRESNEDVLELVSKHVDIISDSTHVASTTTVFNILKLPETKFNNLINLKRINDIRRINKYFEAVNSRLPEGGVFIDCVETYSNRKVRILKRSFFPLNWIHYTLDVIVKRVIPKVPVLKKFYFFITKGRNRVLSKAETLGRLYSCGFEIIEEKCIGDKLYFVAKKVKQPAFDMQPTYGPIIRLKRHGKNGKFFNVYKLRTMHAYSEYLQEYVYKMNDLQEGGKFADDFRITSEGKVFRKFWLDELPMLMNLLKGQMKLVGVRPLSSHYFSLYTDELKEKRIKQKPGLIPPFYADLPDTLEEIMESELRYLEQYEKNPFKTDINYFFKAFNNIIFKKARSN